MKHGVGPIPSRIMLVGEAYGEREEAVGEPFVGASGQELNRMLAEAGIMRSECYVTNVVNARPPNNYIGAWIATKKKDITSAHKGLRDKWVLPIVVDGFNQLYNEIDLVKPNIIVAFGNLAMWALTGKWGILKWRGSQLRMNGGSFSEDLEPKVIPVIHPAAVLREWPSRALCVNDLRRVKRNLGSRAYDNVPNWDFIIRPSFDRVEEAISLLMPGSSEPDRWIDLDIETRGGHIACLGLSWSKVDGICIPFMCVERQEGYWNLDEEAKIVWLLRRLLTHPKVNIRWQNGLFDAQYIYRNWHFIPRGRQDTMISQHSLFSALPKGLSFLASMYCNYYVYWKDEGKTWDKNIGEEQLWAYNLQDCIYTRESGEVLAETAKKMGLDKVDEVQQALFYPVLDAMNRGVRIIKDNRSRLAADITEELENRRTFLYDLLGHEINVGSSLQMQKLFYEDLAQRPILKRTIVEGTTLMRPTCDDEALTKIAAREPLLKSVCNAIADIRTLGKWLNDFVMMQEDIDGRMRCSFNIAGDAGGKSAPYSYRLSSSKNPFGSGGNLQTIPSEKSKSSGKAAARGSMDFTLPNIRSMYGPDPGFTFFDGDLDRADLQVVVWESNDEMLKAALRLGADIHLLNVYSLDNMEPPPLHELVEGHPRYPDHRGPRKLKREFAKIFCHATNYVGSAKTISEHTGRSINEVDMAQKRWFGAHPNIKLWHSEVQAQITKRRYVENKFGYRWYIFDRLEGLLPEAVAWIPQSTVGVLINKIWIAFYQNIPEVQMLMQVHDSLCGQFPSNQETVLLQKMEEQAKIVIPYNDPLIIPFNIKTSRISWGDCA